ncbi:MAG: sterol desaturase family protein [Ottowia sp.]|nr:sterol desaturase family protein [Ottowia sp.]
MPKAVHWRGGVGDRWMVQPLARLSRSRANLWLGLGCDWLAACLLCGAALAHGGLAAPAALLIVPLGLLMFSFVEYAAHRWLFHGRTGPLRAGHARHHRNPAGYDALPFFLPPLVMAGLAGLLMLVLPTAMALLLAGVFAMGYALYGSSHVILHARRFRTPLLARWQRFHDVHHSHPGSNFGVTTGLWDWLLGTEQGRGRK